MNNLQDIYKKLVRPNGKNDKEFKIGQINKTNHFLGLNAAGEIGILFKSKKPNAKIVHLTNLILEHNVSCTIIKSDGNKSVDEFTLLKCKELDQKFQQVFLKHSDDIIKKLSKEPTQKEIFEVISNLVNLFDKLSKQSKKSLIGLWGELFIINNSKNKEKLVRAWHNSNNETWDFYSDKEALEVKTTETNSRSHHFSYEQLNVGKENLIIASIMLRYSRQGKTVNDLMKSILSNLKDNELIIKFNTLCDEIITNKSDDDINECIYEYEYAQQNINFYEVGKIPRVKENLMPGVSDVNFTSKLNNIDSIEDFDNFNFYKFI
jgi:hypothetical protein